MKKIVIVGGGSGGLELATQLGNQLGKNKKAEIILVDKNPSHLWKPLLHEIATGALDDNVDDVNYVGQAKRNHFTFKQGELLNIDRENKSIKLAALNAYHGEILSPECDVSYDILVMAIGSKSNDFGTPGVKENCIFLDDHIQARRFRKKVLNILKRYSSGLIEKNSFNVAIVGGGATGVELAAELYHMVEKLHNYGFQNVNKEMLNVTVIEAADRILPVLPEKLSTSITNKLTDIGVKVLTKTMITKADNTGFYPKEGDVIEADIMVWAAGVKAPDFLKEIAGLETSRSNQLVIKPTLQTTRDDDIFVIGDCASCPKKEGGFVPPTAQAAHQMANLAAKNISAYLSGLPILKDFKYKDKGTIISLAETAQGSVTTVGKSYMIVKGCPAHMIYRTLYRMHQAALFGNIKTGRLILSNRVFRSIRPTLKLN